MLDIFVKVDTVAAGIAVRAADTGRVLMLQRANDPADPAAGMWEFPGGKLEDGEDPRAAAEREWQEEMGVPLPAGEPAGGWRSGVYQCFVHEIPTEADLHLNVDSDDRTVTNPDDPDGDNAEVAAWWSPDQLRGMRALRDELRASRPWSRVAKQTPDEVEALEDERAAQAMPESATLEEDEAAALAAHDYEAPESKAQIPNPPAEIPIVKADPVSLRLHVGGVHRDGSRHRYRMVSRDGQYVGMTNPTATRAVKGDVLVVEPNLFGRNDQGDFTWTNPNVAGRHTGRAMGRRTLEALAGGDIVKDQAAPAADDASSGSGPTSRGVHVDSPLANLSVFYGGKRRRLEKAGMAEPTKQLIYGIVLEPFTTDSQGDTVASADVEAAAHHYLSQSILGRTTVHRDQHGAAIFNSLNPKIVPVESFVAPVDFSYDGRELIRKGSWVLVAHVLDKKLWRRILRGYTDGELGDSLTGWSVGGSGRRRPLSAAL